MAKRFSNIAFSYKALLMGGLLASALSFKDASAQEITTAPKDTFALSKDMTGEPAARKAFNDETINDAQEENYPVTISSDKSDRSKWSFYMPFACHHYVMESIGKMRPVKWGGKPVSFNERKNFGAFVNYAFYSNKTTDVMISGGFYNNSINTISTALGIEATKHKGRFSYGAKVGGSLYNKNIGKTFFENKNGETGIIPKGIGAHKVVPMALLNFGMDIMHIGQTKAGLMLSQTYEPQSGMNLTTLGVTLGFARHQASHHKNAIN